MVWMDYNPALEENAYDHFVRLDTLYFIGCIFILTFGGILTARVLLIFFPNFSKLNSVVKSYMSVILPDVLMVVNFWPRDIHNLSKGGLQHGGWCRFSAFIAIVAVTTLNSGAVCIAYTTYRMVIGSPMEDKKVLIWNGFSWLFGIVLAGIFLSVDMLGPYKQLYCCVIENKYRIFAVAPIIIVTFSAIITMSYFYWKCYMFIKEAEGKTGAGASGGSTTKASQLIMKRGITLVSTFYICWSVMIINGFSTAVGKQVHPGADVLAAWMAKMMPVVDSWMLLQMLQRILGKAEKTGTASRAASSHG